MRILLISVIFIVALFSSTFGQGGSSRVICSGDLSEIFAKPTNVPRPNYPPAAVAVRATGDVVVFLTINPEGKVVTTSVQNGHPLLKRVSEMAALETTFEPIKQDCQRVATLVFTFLTGPPETDEKIMISPFHTEIFARERTVPKIVNGKNVCSDLRFMALAGEAPTLSIKEALQYPECVEGRPIRLYGIYRVAFENSDYYDPSGTDSAWLEFSPFYSIIKKCSSPGTLNPLNSKDGGTFGLVAYGILRTGGEFGHMNGWNHEFQLMCVDDVKRFSKEGIVFEYQPADVQEQILNWYKKTR